MDKKLITRLNNNTFQLANIVGDFKGYARAKFIDVKEQYKQMERLYNQAWKLHQKVEKDFSNLDFVLVEKSKVRKTRSR